MVVTRTYDYDVDGNEDWYAEIGMSAIVVKVQYKSALPFLLYRSMYTPKWWVTALREDTQAYLDKAGLVGYFQWVPKDALVVVERGVWERKSLK